MKVRSFYIIKKDSGRCLYHKEFAESIFDPDLISSFISAMTSFFNEATRSIDSQARAFEGTDYKILVEFGKWTLGAVSATEDTELIRQKLRNLVDRFEEIFNILEFVDMDLAVHSRFENEVREEFVREQISEDSIIHPKLNWDMITKDPDVVAFLSLIPDACTVEDAADFLEVPLEIAMDLAAKAYWETAITIFNPAKPDDIYQATSLVRTGRAVDGVSQESAELLTVLDGETPLSIVAERIKTSDLKRFLDNITTLAQRRAVEPVSEAQAALIMNSHVLQSILKKSARIVGYSKAREIFLASQKALKGAYPWLVFISLEESVDVEVKSSLSSAAVKGDITPEALRDGYRALMQFITKRVASLTGSSVVSKILSLSRNQLRKNFPNTAYSIEWELMTA